MVVYNSHLNNGPRHDTYLYVSCGQLQKTGTLRQYQPNPPESLLLIITMG